jgi:hypothetical protein
MDDILVHSPTLEQHFTDLEEVLRRVHQAGVSMRLEKCSFIQSEVKFLGLLVSGAGLRPDPRKLQAVDDYPEPRDISEVRRALGLFSFYRQFIPGFAHLAEPLHELLRGLPAKGKKRSRSSQLDAAADFHWDESQRTAFAEFKRRLVTAPVLHHPDFSRTFYVHTDASNFAAGAVLVQLDSRLKPAPIGYFSRAFNPAQRKYSATERECLAVRLAIAHFREYLGPVTNFVVVTDHAALLHVLEMKDPSSRIARWQMYFQGYNFTVEHRRGRDHLDADALSRSPQLMPVNTVLPDLDSELPTLDTIREAQMSDRVLQGFITFLEGQPLSGIPDDIRSLLVALDDFAAIDGILYHLPRKARPKKQRQLQLVIPREFRLQVLRMCHDNPTSGHLGVAPTYDRLALRYWWTNMYADTLAYCRTCPRCASRNRAPVKNTSGLVTHTTPERPFATVGIDLVGPLPVTPAGYGYLLVCVDYFSRWPVVIPLKDATAPSVAEALIQHVFLVYGAPEVLLSDQGPQFTSELLECLNQLFITRHVFSSGYRPQTAGLVERFNRTLLDMLAKVVS